MPRFRFNFYGKPAPEPEPPPTPTPTPTPAVFQVYDIESDGLVPLTQETLHRYEVATHAYGALRKQILDMAADYEKNATVSIHELCKIARGRAAIVDDKLMANLGLPPRRHK